jgi:hypothetical protein
MNQKATAYLSMNASKVEQRDYYPMIFYPRNIIYILNEAEKKSSITKLVSNFNLEPIPFPFHSNYYLSSLKNTRLFLAWLAFAFVSLITIAFIIEIATVVIIATIVPTTLFFLSLIIERYRIYLIKKMTTIDRKILIREYKLPFLSKSSCSSFITNLILETLDERESIYDFYICEAKKGISEAYFLNFLQTWFDYPWRIVEHCQFKQDNYTPTADFVLINDDFNIAIDIEIDEPYAFQDYTPIHLVEDKKYIFRDNFFLNLNYIVVRFAEYQIAQHPDYCCLTIVKVLNQLLDLEFKIKIPDTVKITPLKPEDWLVKTWTKQESIVMAQNKTRDLYLQPVIEFNSPIKK